MIKKRKSQKNEVHFQQKISSIIPNGQQSVNSINPTKFLNRFHRPLIIKNGQQSQQSSHKKSQSYLLSQPAFKFNQQKNREEVNSYSNNEKQENEQTETSKSFFSENTFSTFTAESKILINNELMSEVQRMFPFQIRLKLIYQASRHKFSVQNFHQECDRSRNTLTLCSVNGNILGGFTPLKWQDMFQKQGTHFKSDFSNSTFLFNLTTKQKFQLAKVSKNKAVLCCNYLGPSFGGGYDFSIGNQANKRYTSSCNFPASFTDVKQGTKLNRKSLIGTNQQQFLIDQWQVFQVHFNNDCIRYSQSINTYEYIKTQKLKKILTKNQPVNNARFSTFVGFFKEKLTTFIQQENDQSGQTSSI